MRAFVGQRNSSNSLWNLTNLDKWPNHRFYKGGSLGERLDANRVPSIFKRLAKLVGVDPSDVSGHLARVGMAQDLVEGEADLPAIMQAGRWKTSRMPARYTEHQAANRNAVAQFFGK